MKKKFIIAVDFDGTIADNAFPDIRQAKLCKTIVGDLKYFRAILEKEGFEPIVVLWTCRSDNEKGSFLSDAVQFCKNHEIQIDYVNESPEHPMFEGMKVEKPSPKIYADFYLDDKASSALRPNQVIYDDFNRALKNLKSNLKHIS